MGGSFTRVLLLLRTVTFTWQKMKRCSGVPLRSSHGEPGLQLWAWAQPAMYLFTSGERSTENWYSRSSLGAAPQPAGQEKGLGAEDTWKLCGIYRNTGRLCQSYCSPWVSLHPKAAQSFTSPTILHLGCQGLPHLQWMLSLGIAQLGRAGTSHESNTSSYIQGCTERGRMKARIKLLFAFWFFTVFPFSRKKAFHSFFQGSDVSKIQCPKNWSKSFALCCMAALERKSPQPEKRDRATVELVELVAGQPSMTAKAKWVAKAEVELTAYSMFWFWHIIINIRACSKASRQGILEYECTCVWWAPCAHQYEKYFSLWDPRCSRLHSQRMWEVFHRTALCLHGEDAWVLSAHCLPSSHDTCLHILEGNSSTSNKDTALSKWLRKPPCFQLIHTVECLSVCLLGFELLIALGLHIWSSPISVSGFLQYEQTDLFSYQIPIPHSWVTEGIKPCYGRQDANSF